MNLFIVKTKIKLYGDRRVNTNFLGKKVPKEKASQNCLSLMSLFVMLDSVIRINKKYYPEALLEECKYEKKKKKENKMENLINDDFFYLSSSDNETDSDSDNETDNESDNDESNE